MWKSEDLSSILEKKFTWRLKGFMYTIPKISLRFLSKSVIVIWKERKSSNIKIPTHYPAVYWSAGLRKSLRNADASLNTRIVQNIIYQLGYSTY